MLSLLSKDDRVKLKAETLYQAFRKAGVEVLWDDRELASGEKFADGDLLGLPYRVVISERTLAENKVEVKERKATATTLLTEEELIKRFTA